MKLVAKSCQQKVQSIDDPLLKDLLKELHAGESQICSLSLRGNSYSKLFFQKFKEPLARLKALRVLDINDVFVGRLKDEIPESILHIASGLRTISILQLDISNNAVNPFGAKSLSTFLSLKNPLKKLLINNCGLGIDGFREITQGLAAGCAELEVLSIGRNRAENQGAILVGEALPNLKAMRQLFIFQNNIRREGMLGLLQPLLQYCPEIRVLDLQDNFLEEDCVPVLSKLLQSAKLQSLNLSDCNIKQGSNEAIVAAIEGCKTITRVGYNYNELNQEQAVRLGQALGARECQRLEVKGNDLKRKARSTLKEMVKGKVICTSDDQEQDIIQAFSNIKLSQ